MGNSLGGKKSTKVMKIDGSTLKFKTPINARAVLKDFPGHVLLESEAAKHYGIRAKPLEPQQQLKAKRLYFLVELPKFPEEKAARRIRSGIQMSAKDRLESLMLARRSASDLTIMRPPSAVIDDSKERSAEVGAGGGMKLKLRLPKAEVEKLMRESKDDTEVAEKIMKLCMANGGSVAGGLQQPEKVQDGAFLQQGNWENASDNGIVKRCHKTREKRVGFLPITEGEIQLAVA